MSSSRPYQSRLLSFISQQSQRFTDSVSRTFRHIKVATTWGTQILLYPAYVLFQTSRLLGRQLQQEVRPDVFRLKSTSPKVETPTVDTPIQRVFETIADFWSTPSSTSSTSNRPRTRDQATVPQPQFDAAQSPQFFLPEEFKVTNLDLTLADLLQSQPTVSPIDSPLAVIEKVPTSNLVFAPTNSLTTKITPEGLLITSDASVMAETATLGLTANRLLIRGVASLLVNRSLVLVTDQNQILNILAATQQRQLHQRMIWEVAAYHYALRSQRLMPPQSPRQLPPLAQRSLLLAPLRLFRQVMSWMQQGPVAGSINLFRESNLILPTIQESEELWNADTFGSELMSPKPLLKEHHVHPATQLLPSSPSIPPMRRESWLTFTDLFGDNDQLPPESQSQPQELEQHLSLVTISNPQTSPTVAASIPQTLTSSRNPQGQILRTSPASAITPSHTSTPNSSKMVQTWIEIEAKPVGYVNHPLERVIGWIDRAILQIEELVVAIAAWLRKLWWR